MTKPKKPQTNPIEEAIGERAKTTKDVRRIVDTEEFKNLAAEQTPETPSRVLRDAPDQPLTPTEMVDLEELNRQTEERFLDNDPEPQTGTLPQDSVTVPQETTTIPVSKPNLQPEIETSSQESQPPQKVDKDADLKTALTSISEAMKDSGGSTREYTQEEAKEAQEAIEEENLKLTKKVCSSVDTETPVEDKDLTALKEYILDNGFTVAGVAMHIVVLCAQPMVTPATPDWDFVDRANVPDLVFGVLRQPGYLDGIWPSLRIVMGTSSGNSAWAAGVATTLAFFDVIRILPALKTLEVQK